MTANKLLSKDVLYMFAVYLSMFIVGWDDGTTGPLIPRMQESYHLTYTIVSLIFVCKCAGVICAAILNMWTIDRYGFGIAISAGSLLQLISLAIMAPRPPFPVLCVAQFLDGFSAALQDAQANAFLSIVPINQHARMMIGHGMYGFGAFCAPLVSTQFATQKHWTYMYLVSLGIAMINITSLALILRGKRAEVLIRHMVQPESTNENANDNVDSGDDDDAISVRGFAKYKQLLALPSVHLAALFIFTYVGVEVSLGNWSVTFIQRERGGGASAGYVSSGFFGGLTAGRFALIWVTQAIGEQNVVYVYSAICVGLELTVWLVHSLWENAIAISLVGFFLGPLYPILVLCLAKFIPPKFISGAVGWITCLGATGAAVFPFLTGVIAQNAGVWSMQPLAVALLGSLIVVWALLILVGNRTRPHPPSNGVVDTRSYSDEKIEPANTTEVALESQMRSRTS